MNEFWFIVEIEKFHNIVKKFNLDIVDPKGMHSLDKGYYFCLFFKSKCKHFISLVLCDNFMSEFVPKDND